MGLADCRGRDLGICQEACHPSLHFQEGTVLNTEVTFGGPQHIDPRLLAATRVLVAQSQEEVQVSGFVDGSTVIIVVGH